MQVVQWLTAHSTEILAGALVVSEGLAAIPQVKSNSIYQVTTNILKTVVEASKQAPKK